MKGTYLGCFPTKEDAAKAVGRFRAADVNGPPRAPWDSLQNYYNGPEDQIAKIFHTHLRWKKRQNLPHDQIFPHINPEEPKFPKIRPWLPMCGHSRAMHGQMKVALDELRSSPA